MNKTHQKTIVFDLGNVLLSFDFQLAANQLAKHAQLSGSEIVGLINQSQLLHQFERGEISSEEFYTEVAQASKYQESLDQFRMDFSDIFEEIHPMVDFFRQLKRNGNRVALFSNTNEMATTFIRKKFSFFSDFDATFLSYQHGLMKPDAALYRIVETSLERSGEELFFIDDRPENIKAAIERNWSGIMHTDAYQTINAANTWLTA
ncbi:HAD family phosphatase [Verrucomicrobia bacterium]|nr:HAD family phosphatase [Verrucomicrobiota bacterium]